MIQPLKTGDCGTLRPDSISFPLCSDYTFIREPVSLPELAEFRDSKTRLRTALFCIIFHFREVAWWGHCYSICFSFHDCGPLSADHVSIGPMAALLYKLSARIFHTQTPESQCLSIRVCNVQGLQPDINIQTYCAHFVLENEKLQCRYSVPWPLCPPVFNLSLGFEPVK